MQKIHYSIHINSPVEKVWNTMLEPETYQEWTKVFDPQSRYVGSWEKGSEIKFIGIDPKTGAEMGMFSMVRENRLHEFVSLEHVGLIENGVIDTTSEKVKSWVPAFENYTFKEVDGGTEVSVDMDIAEEHKASFEEQWPRALQALKELAEK